LNDVNLALIKLRIIYLNGRRLMNETEELDSLPHVEVNVKVANQWHKCPLLILQHMHFVLLSKMPITLRFFFALLVFIVLLCVLLFILGLLISLLLEFPCVPLRFLLLTLLVMQVNVIGCYLFMIEGDGIWHQVFYSLVDQVIFEE
jgi:hypothetical protein